MKILTTLRTHILAHKKIALIIAILFVLGGWRLYITSNASSTKTQYVTEQAQKGTLIVTVSASGIVSSANTGAVTTGVSGVVKKIFVKNGQIVKSGEKIAEMDLDQESKQKYASAIASYNSAKNSVESAKTNLYSLQSKMFASNEKFMNGAAELGLGTGDTVYIQQNSDWLASEATYKNQQQVIAQTQASLSSAYLSLQQSSPIIYAPISGTINGLSLQVGSILTAQSTSLGASTAQRIASIKTQAEPTITVNLTEIDIPKVKIGNNATLMFDALPGKTYTGSIVSIDAVGAVSSGVTTYPAVIKLDTATSDIFANMSAQASIITETKDGILLVPTSAVQTQNGQSTVRVMKNNKPQQVQVELGTSSATQVEIISGVNEGDIVITSSIQSSTATQKTGTQSQSPFSMFGGGAGRGGAGAAVRIGR